MQAYLVFAVLLTMVSAAAWSDVRSRRIPNGITLPGLLLGLAIGALGGIGGVLASLGAAAAMLALGLALFAGRVLGGGDVKLLVACAALLGPGRALWALALTGLFGAVLGLLQAARAGVIIPVLLNCRDLMLLRATPGRLPGAGEITPTGAVSVPYGVAIAMGALVAWLF